MTLNTSACDNVTIKKSTVTNGFGLFASRDFVKGETIYQKLYYKIPSTAMNIMFEQNTKQCNQHMMTKIWGDGDDFYITLGIDQYINHSSSPNSIHGVALRDIQCDEEIFEDYSSFDNEDWFQKLNKEMGIWSWRCPTK